jgi:hypothetical protein
LPVLATGGVTGVLLGISCSRIFASGGIDGGGDCCPGGGKVEAGGTLAVEVGGGRVLYRGCGAHPDRVQPSTVTSRNIDRNFVAIVTSTLA